MVIMEGKTWFLQSAWVFCQIHDILQFIVYSLLLSNSIMCVFCIVEIKGLKMLYLSRPKLWEELCDTWQGFGSIFLHDASKREVEPIWGASRPQALAGSVSFRLRIWGAAKVNLISRRRWRNDGGKDDAITLFPNCEERQWSSSRDNHTLSSDNFDLKYLILAWISIELSTWSSSTSVEKIKPNPNSPRGLIMSKHMLTSCALGGGFLFLSRCRKTWWWWRRHELRINILAICIIVIFII